MAITYSSLTFYCDSIKWANFSPFKHSVIIYMWLLLSYVSKNYITLEWLINLSIFSYFKKVFAS